MLGRECNDHNRVLSVLPFVEADDGEPVTVIETVSGARNVSALRFLFVRESVHLKP